MGSTLERVSQLFRLLRTSWSILGVTVVLLLVTEAGFRLSFTLKDWLGSEERPDRRILDEGYGGARWPIQHYRELEKIEDRWQPYVYFRQKPFRGETIAVGADGMRATWQPAPESRDSSGTGHRKLNLLLLGGSSLWGFGARDDQSIPSLVAKMLYDRGSRAELKNSAEIGYVSTQEVVALLRELQAGYRPDVVIFYDGVNDTTSALLEGGAGLSTNEKNRRAEFNLLQSSVRLAQALGARVLQDSGSYRFAQAVRRRLAGASARLSRHGRRRRYASSPRAFSSATKATFRSWKGSAGPSDSGRCSTGSPMYLQRRTSMSWNRRRRRVSPGRSRCFAKSIKASAVRLRCALIQRFVISAEFSVALQS